MIELALLITSTSPILKAEQILASKLHVLGLGVDPLWSWPWTWTTLTRQFLHRRSLASCGASVGQRMPKWFPLSLYIRLQIHANSTKRSPLNGTQYNRIHQKSRWTSRDLWWSLQLWPNLRGWQSCLAMVPLSVYRLLNICGMPVNKLNFYFFPTPFLLYSLPTACKSHPNISKHPKPTAEHCPPVA